MLYLQEFNLVAACILLCAIYARAISFGEAELMFGWEKAELEWPSDAERQAAILNGTYVPERSLVVGIKVHKDDVFVTIPRWFWPSGNPVTLAKVVKVNNKTLLRPYPDWPYQNQSDCRSFQFVMSMEIDPNTDRMYVLDTGRVGKDLNLCPAKIFVFDLKTNTLIQRIELPNEVANRTKNFLNDIVLDYIDGQVRFAYMSDAYDSRIIIYDFLTSSSYFIKHPSMDIEANATVIHFDGKDYDYIKSHVNGIAMSPDFKYVYYCAVSSYKLYQIPTSTLRNVSRYGTSGIRLIGSKISQSGGIAYGNRRLFYGALSLNAVYYWDPEKDMADQKVGADNVTLSTEVLLVRNDSTMQWPDTFAFDNKGWLWFTADRLPLFWDKGVPNDTIKGEPFMRVWRVYVGENGYLHEASVRTRAGNGAGASMFAGGFSLIVLLLISSRLIRLTI